MSADKISLDSYNDDKEDFHKNILWAPRKKREFRRRIPTRGEGKVPRCRKRLVFDVEKEPEERQEQLITDSATTKEGRLKSVPQTPESKKCERTPLQSGSSLISLRRQCAEKVNKTSMSDQNIKRRKLSLFR